MSLELLVRLVALVAILLAAVAGAQLWRVRDAQRKEFKNELTRAREDFDELEQKVEQGWLRATVATLEPEDIHWLIANGAEGDWIEQRATALNLIGAKRKCPGCDHEFRLTAENTCPLCGRPADCWDPPSTEEKFNEHLNELLDEKRKGSAEGGPPTIGETPRPPGLNSVDTYATPVETVHHCNPPFGGIPRDDGSWYSPIAPSLPDGTVWQCACGKLYLAKDEQWWNWSEMTMADRRRCRKAAKRCIRVNSEGGYRLVHADYFLRKNANQ